MKLKIGNKVYLQKYEVTYILYRLSSFPASLLDEIIDDNRENYYSMDGRIDAFQFDCVFEKPANVKWLMDQDWIVDYDEYCDMPIRKLETYIGRLKTRCIDEVTEFNAKEESYRRKHFEVLSDEYHKTDHKIRSLENLMNARRGKILFNLPCEYHRN